MDQQTPIEGQPPDSSSDEQGGTLQLRLPSVTIHWPDGREEERQLDPVVTRIGRESEGNDLVLPAEFGTISRHHCEIRRTPEGFLLKDLDSANGVFVGEERIEGERRLEASDEFRIGAADHDQVIRFVFHPGSLPGAAAQATADPAQTAIHQAPKMADIAGPSLRIHRPGSTPEPVSLEADRSIIGRDPMAQVSLAELPYVSFHHAEIRREEGVFLLTDLDSTNGTRLDGQLIEPGQPVPLHHGAMIRIGDDAFGASIGLSFHNPRPDSAGPAGFHQTRSLSLTFEQQVPETETVMLIGRGDECDLQLEDPLISRKHARLERRDGEVWIRDLESLNGTFVNGEEVNQQRLADGDLIQIHDVALIYQSGELRQFERDGIRLDALGLTQQVKAEGGKRTILEDVNFTALPREFLGLVGASGSGKSTLMNALMGVWPAQGEVLLNGQDLYENYEDFRAQIGYVPQSDIVHTSLTVERALDYAARLRLPPDVGRQERKVRIDRVLETVELADESIRQTRIGQLSGGQRKRVSIAAELLADPKLFFLDEATSGLDPGLEKKMMHTLRRMADEGRTVMLITHATANIIQVDHVVFLAEGKMAYFGPPNQALDFFEVGEFADIYERIQGAGAEWRRRYRAAEGTEAHQQYVEGRQQQARQGLLPTAARQVKSGLRKLVHQWGVLTQRTMEVLASDKLTLALLLLLFPMTAGLQLVIASSNILTGDLSIVADPAAAAERLSQSYVPLPDLNTFVFVTGLEAVLVGMYVPVNELIKERTIYLRERMVNLAVAPYLLSKVTVFTLIALFQSALYLVVLSLGVDFPEQGLLLPFTLEAFLTLFFTMLAGMGIGFLVSSISRSTDMAIYALVMLMFFQFFFAGTVFDLRDNPAEPISYLTATRWSLLALGVSIDMEAQAESTVLCTERPDNPVTPEVESGTSCRHFPEATEDLMLPYEDEWLVRSWAILLAMAAGSLTITGLLIRRLDPI